VVDVEPPERVSGGFDFWVYGLHFGGSGVSGPWAEPLIARMPAVASRYPSLQQESRLLSWVAAQGYPAPPMLELIAPGELFDSPVQVMRRLPGSTMVQAMTAAPWQMARWARRLGTAHVALHRLPVPGWAGWSLAEQRLMLTRRMVARDMHSGLARALERIEPVLPRLDVDSPAVCHGDFHPGNLLVERGTVAAIDWTDAGIGDRCGAPGLAGIGAAPVARLPFFLPARAAGRPGPVAAVAAAELAARLGRGRGRRTGVLRAVRARQPVQR